jgi:predicted GNAT family acetyltransferase
VSAFDGPEAAALGLADLNEALAFYEQSYPGNWFDARMLETGRYYGLWDAGRLVSVAGVHVYSRRYRVAALGNIATDPAHRRKGYGTLVTAQLCRTLLGETDHIGLNVKADNEAAMRCYQRLGFEIVAPYGEFDIGRST